MTSQIKRLTQEQRTHLSEQRMFDAAMDLILEKGTTKTTLKEIGEKAGYSRGLANSRFGSKEKLFEELVNRCYAVWVNELSRFTKGKSGLDALISSIYAFEVFLTETPRDLRVLQILWYDSISHQSSLRKKLKWQHECMVRDAAEYIEDARKAKQIRDDVDSADFSVRYLAFIFGIVYMWLVNPEEISVAEVFSNYRAAVKKELGVDTQE